MAEATSKAGVVPKAGDRVRIVAHRPEGFMYSSLSDWPGYEIGTIHTVHNIIGDEVNIDPCLFLDEIEVVQ